MTENDLNRASAEVMGWRQIAQDAERRTAEVNARIVEVEAQNRQLRQQYHELQRDHSMHVARIWKRSTKVDLTDDDREMMIELFVDGARQHHRLAREIAKAGRR